MTYLLLFAVYLIISLIGSAWYRFEESRSSLRRPTMIPKYAVKNLMREEGIGYAMIINSVDGTCYDHRRGVIFLNDDLAQRRDIEGVSIACHEAAHAVQAFRYSWVLWVVGLYPLAFYLPIFLVVPTIKEFIGPALPFIIIAIVFARAGVEADAWAIAHYRMKKWGYDGIKKRLAIAGVMSYL